MGFASIAYGLLSAALGVVMLSLAVQVYRVRAGERANKVAMKLFSFSILYLFLLFAELIAERSLILLKLVHAA